uniref:Uncharacterized protein n=1 Tax=Trichobilharzia regenti TaxID=157069 RepID=A0AA85IWS5_TRIRE
MDTSCDQSNRVSVSIVKRYIDDHVLFINYEYTSVVNVVSNHCVQEAAAVIQLDI